MIAIVNYGLGNIQAFATIYKRLRLDFAIASSPERLLEADRIILAGVGSFDWAMKRLNESGMRPALEEAVIERGRPVLGICVGMQIMARSSEEGVLAGLGWIEAEVKKFDLSLATRKTYLPHMGWNDVAPVKKNGLFRNLEAEARFYFLHSYYVVPEPQQVLAVTDYIIPYASAVHSGNVYGVQFHPEKSHHWGLQLLKNFAEL